MEQATWFEFLKYKFSRIKPKNIKSIPNCTWGSYSSAPFKDGEFVICPMESGKKAILQLFKKSYSLGGGEWQHFYREKFFEYIAS